jgi:hypothetical protein
MRRQRRGWQRVAQAAAVAVARLAPRGARFIEPEETLLSPKVKLALDI